MSSVNNFYQIYEILLTAYGSQHWWPADTPFEMMVGAILTQNTSWTGAEKAIRGLRESGGLTPEAFLSLTREKLEEIIRPSGYFRQKAERLQNLCLFLIREYRGDLDFLQAADTRKLRLQFLGLHGIGPETADSILLYALGRPVFVVDAYTVRLLARLGLCSGKEKYDEVQALFMDNLEHDAPLFNEYHALIVRHSKRTCSKRAPRCGGCPLFDMCAWNSKTQDPKSKN